MSRTPVHEEDFVERVATFARDAVAPGAAERDRAGAIPRPLWRALAATGLLRAMLPPEDEGLGQPMRAVSAALEALAREGHDPALSIALLPGFTLAQFHLPRLCAPQQKARWLPGIVSGERLAALAFSELPHGANPKHLEATARREGGDWVIDGRKAFVTNGPEADLFVVLAITSREGDRKRFTAFLVERGAAGLTVEERMPIPFVLAAPHCTLRLAGCRVPDNARLGPIGDALAELSGATRTAEDLVGAASLAGHAAWVVSLAAAHRAKDVAGSPELAEALGDLRVAAETLRLRARGLAEFWDRGDRGDVVKGSPSPDEESFTSLLLAGRGLAERFAERLSALLEGAPPGTGSDLERAVRDLEVAKIGGAATRARIRRLGRYLAAQTAP